MSKRKQNMFFRSVLLFCRLHKCIFFCQLKIFNMNSLKGFKKRLKWISCMLEKSTVSFICFRVLNIKIGLWFVMFCFVQPRFSSSILKKNGLLVATRRGTQKQRRWKFRCHTVYIIELKLSKPLCCVSKKGFCFHKCRHWRY